MSELYETGPELDALVAEKVMGWTHDDGQHCAQCKGHWYNQEGIPDEVPPYSTDIAAAWEVVEKLETKSQFAVCRTKVFGWTVFIDGSSGVHADTAPLAICRAALKAVTK